MCRTIQIVASDTNPSAKQLADNFFNGNTLQPGLLVGFAVDEHPFDPRVGATLLFRPMVMERCEDNNYRLKGWTKAPDSDKKGAYWTIVEYNLNERTGVIRIRD